MKIDRSLGRMRPGRASVLGTAALVGVLFALVATQARADVGVEGASRHGGEPGTTVTLTIDCGFCFPPCVGPKGERHPEGFDDGPCMLGPRKEPPTSFEVSIVPRAMAPQLGECGTGPVCTPSTLGPPRRAPWSFLGRAVPPPGGNDPSDGGPRYLLSFEIPDLRPGSYVYEIWCGACVKGDRGALISDPASPRYQLEVH
jgi:hypothetical protein